MGPLDYAYHAFLICLWNRNNSAYFILVYAYIAIHFSMKMSRLVLICGPICAIGCAIWCGWCLDFIQEPVLLMLGKKGYCRPGQEAVVAEAATPEKDAKADGKAKAA